MLLAVVALAVGLSVGALLGRAPGPGVGDDETAAAREAARREVELERLRTRLARAGQGVPGEPPGAGPAELAGSPPAAEPSRAAPAATAPGGRAAPWASDPSAGSGTSDAAIAQFPATLDVLEVLRALDAARAPQTDVSLVGDPAFGLRFRTDVAGPTVRAEETAPGAPLEDGTTIALDEGVYDFTAFANAHRGRFPADLTFRGIGMDRTLLLVHEIGPSGEVRNLSFVDLTLDTRGHYLADVRGDEPVALRFVRARVVGFDAGPGGGVLLAARSGAVLATQSRFEAGFGNAPGTGSFFHVRGPFLVRFDGCTLDGPFRSLYEKSPKAAYAYVDCRFERMHPDRRRDLETTEPNVGFERCLVGYEDPPAEGPARRSLTELCPAWR